MFCVGNSGFIEPMANKLHPPLSMEYYPVAVSLLIIHEKPPKYAHLPKTPTSRSLSIKNA